MIHQYTKEIFDHYSKYNEGFFATT